MSDLWLQKVTAALQKRSWENLEWVDWQHTTQGAPCRRARRAVAAGRAQLEAKEKVVTVLRYMQDIRDITSKEYIHVSGFYVD